MNEINKTSETNDTVLALRREFDQAFAQAPRQAAQAPENLLAIRLGADRYALRITQIAGLYADRRIMPLPTPLAGLLGVAAFRGQIAPVYDLAALQGYARQATPQAPRWLALVMARPQEPLALAFSDFDGHFAVSPEHIIREGNAAYSSSGPGDTVRHGEHLLPVLHVPALIEKITSHTSK